MLFCFWDCVLILRAHVTFLYMQDMDRQGHTPRDQATMS